jgi:hypothetical protein
MNTWKLLVICGLAFFATNSYGGNCYHQIGNLCKGGYTSGFLSDCSTPCNTGVVDKSQKQQPTSNNAGSTSKSKKKKAKVTNPDTKATNPENKQ